MFRVLLTFCVVASLFCLPMFAQDSSSKYRVDRIDGGRYQLKVADRVVAVSERPIENVRVVSIGDPNPKAVAWSEKTANETQAFYAIARPNEEWARPRKADYRVMFKSRQFATGKGESPDVPEPLSIQPKPNSPQLYCAQFHTPSLPSYRTALRNAGAEVFDYLPNYCYIVRMTPETAEKIQRLEAVRWVGLLHPYYKIGEKLLGEESRDFAGKKRFNLYAASVKDRRSLANQVVQLRAGFESQSGRRIVPAELTSRQLADLLRSPLVQWVEPWQPVEEDMNNARIQGGADFIEAAAAVPAGYTGIGIRGHVLEGIQATHADFAANAHRLAPIAVDDAGSTRHGQATFGIIFGSGMNDPVMHARGLLPNAQGLYTNKSFLTGPTGGTGAGTRHDLVRRLITNHQVMFQTASWGNGSDTDYTAHSAELDTIIFDHNIPITQSQSNFGTQLSRPEAWSKNVISVGAVVHVNNSNPADDSWNSGHASIGPAADGRKKPDLCGYFDSIRTTGLANGYLNFGKTSGATPIVAGHVGLVLEMWTNGDFGNTLKVPGGTRFQNRPNFTTAKALLIASAKQYTFNAGSTDNRREHQGWGFPDVKRLYENRGKLLVVDEADVLSIPAQMEKTYHFTVAPGEPVLKICMTFADPAGSPSAAQATVNDLSLRVQSPAGDVYWGNHGLDAGMFSATGGSADHADTVECVFIENPPPGCWQVTVSAEEINADAHTETTAIDADFALVVLGITKP